MPQSTLRVVAIGGGTGLATLLRGLKRYVHAEGPWTITDLGAIVTVTDEGGGRVRYPWNTTSTRSENSGARPSLAM